MLADVERALYNLPLPELLKCEDILKDAIDVAYMKHKEEVSSKDINDYVEYDENFIPPDSVEFANLDAELDTLNIRGKKGGTNSNNAGSLPQIYPTAGNLQ